MGMLGEHLPSPGEHSYIFMCGPPRVQAQPGQARTRREQHPLLLSCFRVSLLTLSCFASTSLQSPVTAPRSQNPARDGGPHSGLALICVVCVPRGVKGPIAPEVTR